MRFSTFFFLVLSFGSSVADFIFTEQYNCAVCNDVLDGISCKYFGSCHLINSSVLNAFGSCEAAGFCDYVYPSSVSRPTSSALDLRVSKGFGSKPYSSMRLSVVTKSGVTPPFNTSSFDYSAPFRYKWTDNVLHSSIVNVQPGEKNIFSIGTTNISIWLPKQGAGVAGLLIADPCVHLSSTTSWVGCKYANTFATSTRLPAMLDAMLKHDDTDFWAILGDNFYDRTGEITRAMYDKFTLATKSKMMMTVPGNHDYWVVGTPGGGTTADQYANGHMQWYAMDAKAAETLLPPSNNDKLGLNINNMGIPPFNFSIDPSSKKPGALPDITNAFWYQQIGNIAVVGYSGGYSLEETTPLMQEACSWMSDLHTSGSVAVSILVGHWDKVGMGCGKEMSVPDAYDHIIKLDGCSQLSEKKVLKFFMGHTHCNQVHPHSHVDTGFMVAGQGMSGCGNYGFPIMDTTENRLRIWHFEVVSSKGVDSYDKIYQCISAQGWRNCTNLAEKWLDQPF